MKKNGSQFENQFIATIIIASTKTRNNRVKCEMKV